MSKNLDYSIDTQIQNTSLLISLAMGVDKEDAIELHDTLNKLRNAEIMWNETGSDEAWFELQKVKAHFSALYNRIKEKCESEQN